MNKLFTLFAVSFFLFSSDLSAQNEIARERSSLRGISELGVVINIEKPADLETEHLDVVKIRTAIEDNFSDIPVSVLDDRTLRRSDEYPILHVHINVMKAANNTYPFSIELNFYQPVKLVLNRDMKTMASTWNKGQVGIVSGNMFHVIAEEAVYSSNLFKDEYQMVNL